MYICCIQKFYMKNVPYHALTKRSKFQNQPKNSKITILSIIIGAVCAWDMKFLSSKNFGDDKMYIFYISKCYMKNGSYHALTKRLKFKISQKSTKISILSIISGAVCAWDIKFLTLNNCEDNNMHICCILKFYIKNGPYQPLTERSKF